MLDWLHSRMLHSLHPHTAVFLGHGGSRLLLLAGSSLFAVVLYFALLRWLRPSAEEQERRRREQLASTGRITTGELLEARTLDGEESYSPTPEVLLYSYRLAGVTYSCAQDVSQFPERIRGFSIEGPVQVRYDPRNPCNSVLVAENWSGLWLMGQHS